MWARIKNGTVAEITDINPEGRFHPSILWVPCSSDILPGWSYDGEQCLPPTPDPLEDLAAHKRYEIVQARDAAFAAGLEYDIDGESDVVQTRPEDQINLLGLSAKALRLIADGISDPVMPFRGLSNVTRMLTPEQMDSLTFAALTHIEGIYQHSWNCKDAIDAALNDRDREGVEAIHW